MVVDSDVVSCIEGPVRLGTIYAEVSEVLTTINPVT